MNLSAPIAILAGQFLADLWTYRRRRCRARSQLESRQFSDLPLPVNPRPEKNGEELRQTRKDISITHSCEEEALHIRKDIKEIERKKPLIYKLQSRLKFHRYNHSANTNHRLAILSKSNILRGRHTRMRRPDQQHQITLSQPDMYYTRSGRAVIPTWKVLEDYETERLSRCDFYARKKGKW